MQLHVKIFVFGLLACPSALMQAAESDNSAAAWTFSQCLDYAYSNNISLQRLVLDNQSDEVTLEQSKAQWQPTLGFSTTQGYINYASPSESQTANVYSGAYDLNASWTVFNGNIRRNQIKYDEMQQRISALGVDEQRYTLQTEILSKYLNILYAKEAIAIARKNVEVSKYQMERAEALMNSGKLSRVDYSQIESQWHIDDAEIAAELPRKTTVFDTACSWMPALQRYKLAGEAEQYSIDIARGGYYPTVSLNAGVGTSNTSGSGNLGTQLKERLNEQISVTVSVPILDQKKNKTAVAKARIAQLNADLDYQEAMTSLSQTIEGIYIDAENAQSKYESCAEKLKSASLTDELVNEQFALGLVNTLDLLNAHSSLLTAQQELLQAKYLTILNKRLLNFYQTQQISL